MIDNFFLFTDLNRDSNKYPLEDVFTEWRNPSTKIISMGDEEEAYLFSMQFMLGEANIIPFQKFHDDYWCDGNYKKTNLQSYMRGYMFCTDPRFLEYMMDNKGDLKWQKNQREKAHWSQPTAQHRLLRDFLL